jgi:hypothetical protein
MRVDGCEPRGDRIPACLACLAPPLMALVEESGVPLICMHTGTTALSLSGHGVAARSLGVGAVHLQAWARLRHTANLTFVKGQSKLDLLVRFIVCCALCRATLNVTAFSQLQTGSKPGCLFQAFHFRKVDE